MTECGSLEYNLLFCPNVVNLVRFVLNLHSFVYVALQWQVYNNILLELTIFKIWKKNQFSPGPRANMITDFRILLVIRTRPLPFTPFSIHGLIYRAIQFSIVCNTDGILKHILHKQKRSLSRSVPKSNNWKHQYFISTGHLNSCSSVCHLQSNFLFWLCSQTYCHRI